MMPNTRVSPLETRNSSRPYCTPFRSWIRKVWKSTKQNRRHWAAGLILADARAASAHLALGHDGRIVVQRLHRDAPVLVLDADHLAQVHVLHRVVGLRQVPIAARAVHRYLFHGGDQLLLPRDIAVDRLQAGSEQESGVVALDGVDVGLELVGLRVGEPELLIALEIEIVGVVQRGLYALRGTADRLEHAISEE